MEYRIDLIDNSLDQGMIAFEIAIGQIHEPKIKIFYHIFSPKIEFSEILIFMNKIILQNFHFFLRKFHFLSKIIFGGQTPKNLPRKFSHWLITIFLSFLLANKISVFSLVSINCSILIGY